MTTLQILSAFNLDNSLTPGYQGLAFRVRRTDKQEKDISYIDGDIDIASMESFVGNQSWAIIKVYD